jgi:hypothetical protein
MSAMITKWREQPGRKFDDWYEDELHNARTGIIEVAGSLGQQTVVAGVARELRNEMLRNGIQEEQFIRSLREFLESPAFEGAPAVRIAGALFAAMARKVTAGQRSVEPSFFADVRTISSLLPYCDAVFVDDECRALLSENPLPNMLKFGTRVFSIGTGKAFLAYLEGLKEAVSRDQIARVHEVYGP